MDNNADLDPVKTSRAAETIVRAARWGQALEEVLNDALDLQLQDDDAVSDEHIDALKKAVERWAFAEREIARLVEERLAELARLVAPFDVMLHYRFMANDPPELGR